MSTDGASGVEFGEEAGGIAEDDPAFLLEGFKGDGIGDVGFSGAGRAGEEDIFVAGDEGAGGQIGHEAAVKGGDGREIEMSQGFVGVTARLFDTSVEALSGAAFEFIIEEENQEFGGAEFLGGGLRGAGVEGEGHAAQFELS